MLYRPRLPSTRAQAIQVLHAAHALAERGHRVTVLADRGEGDVTPEGVLREMGLPRCDALDLRVAPTTWRPGASAWFRWNLARWEGDLVLARAKRYVPLVPARVPVVLEVHEVDSLLAEEAGRPVDVHLALERGALARAAGVIANCEGTLAALQRVHALPRSTVVHNATRPDRAIRPAPTSPRTVLWAGSPHHDKGLRTVLASVTRWPSDVELCLLGGAPAGVALPESERRPGTPRSELRSPACVRSVPPVSPAEVPHHLASASVLLLSLADDLFGRELTSPLKLWDYLATPLPIVAPELPSVRRVVQDDAVTYRAGDPASLAEAVRRALDAPWRRPRLRTWADRAAEVEGFLRKLGISA